MIIHFLPFGCVRKISLLLLCTVFTLFAAAQVHRMPAYPLISHDPYFSIWSFSDTATAEPTKHWTGTNQSLIAGISVDGKYYRILGKETPPADTALASSGRKQDGIKAAGAQSSGNAEKKPAMEMTGVQEQVTVTATRTVYEVACGPVQVTMSFVSPLILNDLHLLSRPVSYIDFLIRSNDGKAHKTRLQFIASGNLALNDP